MRRQVYYFNGNPYPREYIDSLPAAESAKIDHRLDFMCENPVHTWPWVDHIDGKLWELKSGAHRLLYCLREDDVVILHACRKRGRRLKRKELAIAEGRLDSLSQG